MKQYLSLMGDVLQNGVEKTDRTGTGTISVFGRQLTFNLQEGFPLLTTKKMFYKGAFVETLWYLRGDASLDYLHENGVHYWDKWATKDGSLGPVYPEQFRHWEIDREWTVAVDRGRCTVKPIEVDQLQTLIDGLRNRPDSRRHLVSAWNVAKLPDETMSPQENVLEDRMALAPCHAFFQCYVANGELSLQVYQRSADVFIGLPVNIASYALLTHLLAHQCDLLPGKLIWVGGDVHLYSDHIEQAELQRTRMPKDLPKLKIKRKPPSLFEYEYEDFELEGYDSWPHIAAPVAV